jgi:hypothetical protein
MNDSSKGSLVSAPDAFTRLLVCNDQDMKWFTAADLEQDWRHGGGLAFS